MLKKIMQIDRRIIFILVALAVIIPTLLKVSFPITVSEPTRKLYDYIEDLPSGSTVLIAFDYGPSSMAELQPMGMAFLRHCFQKKIQVIGMTLVTDGATLGYEIMQEAAKTTDAIDGEDYVYLGFRPGTIQVMLGMGTTINSIFESDYSESRKGKPLAEIPMMAEIKNYDQIDLVLDLASSSTTEAWIAYINTRYNQKIAAGVTGVIISQMYPYLQTEQLIGLMPGLMGAAEYETLIDTPAKATKRMSVQSFVHLLVFGLVILGNVAFFIEKRENENV
ncbi:MAG: hypothetical protein VX289_05170 [Candidatus Poribacteria bacterium]|nr:hypothetical protein [Candidatus Poribacteria bacterium]